VEFPPSSPFCSRISKEVKLEEAKDEAEDEDEDSTDAYFKYLALALADGRTDAYFPTSE
jgi:hypothetical protein